jgi:predicted RNA-binding Zn-ribbon protein involved in translation (DUF1610 family)
MTSFGDTALPERFWDKVRITKFGRWKCWVWTAHCINTGYGQTSRSGKLMLAHRWSYETFVGPLDPELVVHHRCENPPCVNPRHLKQVTSVKNVSYSKPSHTGVCQSGRHVWNAEQRECVKCKLENNKKKKSCPKCGKLISTRHMARHKSNVHGGIN